MIEKEDEVLNIKLLPSWFKVGTKVDIGIGRRKGYYGFIKAIVSGDKYEDNITRAKVDVPGTGNLVYKVGSLSKSRFL